MENYEFESRVRIDIKNILEYVPNGIFFKSFLDTKAGKIIGMAVDYGKIYTAESTAFTSFIEVIEGKAEVVMDDVSTYLQNQEYMIIPRDIKYTLEANEKFKVVITQLLHN